MLNQEESPDDSDRLSYTLKINYPSANDVNVRLANSKIATIERILLSHFDVNYSWKDLLERFQKSPGATLQNFTDFLDALLCHDPLIQKFCIEHLFKLESDPHLGICLNKIKDELLEMSASEINAHVRNIFKIKESEKLPYFKNHNGEILTGLSLYASMLSYSNSSKNHFGHIAFLCSEILFHPEHREEKIQLFKDLLVTASESNCDVIGTLHKIIDSCSNSQEQLEVLKMFVLYTDTHNEELSSLFLNIIKSSLSGRDSISSIVEDAEDIVSAIAKHPKISKQVIDSLSHRFSVLELKRENEIRSNGNALPTIGNLFIEIIGSLLTLPEVNEFSSWLMGEKNILDQILETYGKRPSIKRMREGLNDLIELLVDKENGSFRIQPSQVFGKNEKEFFIKCGWRVFRAIHLLKEKRLAANPGVSNLGDLIKNSINTFYKNIHWIDPFTKQKRDPTRSELEAAQGVYFNLMTHILAGRGRNSWSDQGQAEFILAVIAPAVVSDYIHSGNYRKIKLPGIENKFTRYTRALDSLLSECTQEEILKIYDAMAAIAAKRGFPLKFSEILFVDGIASSGIIPQDIKLKRKIFFNIILIPLTDSIKLSKDKKLQIISSSKSILDTLINNDAETNASVASYLSLHGVSALESLEYLLCPENTNKFLQDKKFITFLLQALKESKAQIPQSEREVFFEIAHQIFKESQKVNSEIFKTVLPHWSAPKAQQIKFVLNKIFEDKTYLLNPLRLKASLSLLDIAEADLDCVPVLYQILSEKNIDLSDEYLNSLHRSVKILLPLIQNYDSPEIKNQKVKELFILITDQTSGELKSLTTFLEILSLNNRNLFLSKDKGMLAKFKTYHYLNSGSYLQFSQSISDRIVDSMITNFESKEIKRASVHLKSFIVPKSPETSTAIVRNILDSAFVTYGNLKFFDPLTCDLHQEAFKERMFRTFSDIQYQLFLDLQNKEEFERLSIFFHESINDVMYELDDFEISDGEKDAIFHYVGSGFFEYLAAHENKKCSHSFKIECIKKLKEKIKYGNIIEFENFLNEHNLEVLIPHIEPLIKAMGITPLLYDEMPLQKYVMQWDLSVDEKYELSKRLSYVVTGDQPKKDSRSVISKLQKLYGAGDNSVRATPNHFIQQQSDDYVSPQLMRQAGIQDLFALASLDDEKLSIEILLSYLPLFVSGNTPEEVMRNLNAFCEELTEYKRQSNEYESRIIVNQKKHSLKLINDFIKRIREEIQDQIKAQIRDSIDSDADESDFVHNQTKELQYWRAKSLCVGLDSHEMIESINASLDENHRAHTELSMSLNSFLVRNAISKSIKIETLLGFIRTSHRSGDFFYAYGLLSSCVDIISKSFDDEERESSGFQSWRTVIDFHDNLTQSLSSKREIKEISIVSLPKQVGSLFTQEKTSATYGITADIDGQQRSIAIVIINNKRQPKIFLSSAGKFIIGKKALNSIVQLVREADQQINSEAN